MEEGGSLAGKESASVLSRVFSLSSALLCTGRSSGSRGRRSESSLRFAGLLLKPFMDLPQYNQMPYAAKAAHFRSPELPLKHHKLFLLLLCLFRVVCR